MRKLYLLFAILIGIRLGVSAETWTITTNTGDATDTGSFGYAFGHAADGDIIAFNIAGTDTIALSATLTRGTGSTYTDYQGTTVTVNGINEATGNPIVIDGSQGAAGYSIYRSHSSDYSAMHMVFNDMVFYKASGSGGGAFNFGHSSFTQLTRVTFNGCTFEKCNGSGGNGGAINAGQDIALTIENCTFNNNTGATQGGAVAAGSSKSVAGCNTVITNCTFFGNTSTGSGGALYSSPLASDPAQVINCTFVGNTAGSGSGGVDAEGNSATTMVNCLAAGNTPVDAMGAKLDLENCIVQTKDASIVTDNNPVAYTDASVFAGGAAVLQNNGGYTQTIAISNDGVALQAGIASLDGFVIPTEDQRGVARLTPPCIGAFDAPTESGKSGLPQVATQAFVALGTGNQIEVISANPGWATVYNLTGSVVEKTYVNGGDAILPAVLSSGIYLVRLDETSGNISVAKVIVK